MNIKKLIAISNLTRWKDNILYSLLNTLIGISFADGWLGYRFVTIFIANWFGIIFMYIINDIEDSEDDAKDERKRKRNPISAGILSKFEAYLILILFGVTSLGIYIYLATITQSIVFAAIAIVTIVIGYLYSAKPIRLKSRFIADILSHSFMLGFAQFILTVMAFPNIPNMNSGIIIATALVIFLYSLSGDLENENRDFEVDRQAGLKNTVQTVNNLSLTKKLHKLLLMIIYMLVTATLVTHLFINYNFNSIFPLLTSVIRNLSISIIAILAIAIVYKFVIKRESLNKIINDNSILELFHTFATLSISLALILWLILG